MDADYNYDSEEEVDYSKMDMVGLFTRNGGNSPMRITAGCHDVHAVIIFNRPKNARKFD